MFLQKNEQTVKISLRTMTFISPHPLTFSLDPSHSLSPSSLVVVASVSVTMTRDSGGDGDGGGNGCFFFFFSSQSSSTEDLQKSKKDTIK